MLSGRNGTTNKIASQGRKDAINKNKPIFFIASDIVPNQQQALRPVPQEHLVLVEQALRPVLENGSTNDYKLNYAFQT